MAPERCVFTASRLGGLTTGFFFMPLGGLANMVSMSVKIELTGTFRTPVLENTPPPPLVGYVCAGLRHWKDL